MSSLFSCSVMSDSLGPHGQQHTRLPCSSVSPGVCSNSCALSQWCHPTISSSVAPFSSCPQSFPVSGSFPMSQLFTSGGQRIGASASVFPMNIQGWFPLGLTGLISLQSKGLWRVFSSTIVQKHQFFNVQFSSIAQSCLTLCNPTDCSMPGSSVLQFLQEFAQTCVHSQWRHPTISSSVAPFSSCPQSLPASGCFPRSWLFTSGSQIIGGSASVFPMNIQGWFPLGLTSLISLQSKGLSSLLQHHSLRTVFVVQLPHPFHDCWENHSFECDATCQQCCLCLWICYLSLSELFFQGASVF